MLLGVLFTAGYCRCDNGVCVYIDDGGDTTACYYSPGVSGGTDITCFTVGRNSGGGGGGPTRTPVPTATSTQAPTPSPTPVPPTLLHAMLGGYAYEDAACGAGDGGDGDPITLVVRSVGDPRNHLYDHGLPDDVSAGAFEDTTGFYDNGSCVTSEIMVGSNSPTHLCFVDRPPYAGICLNDRYHLRTHVESTSDPQYAGLHVIPMTPHFDKAVDPCDPQTATCTCRDQGNWGPNFVFEKHIIPADWFGDARMVSGFSHAWDVVANAWVASGHHMIVDLEQWGNRNPRLQCNGDVARADGMVYMLGNCGDLPALQCP